MTCPGYTPVFGEGQLDGTKYAGFNCNCWSAGKAADYHSCGKTKPSANQVRIWTGDRSGGTNLAQVDYALRAHVGIDLDTRYRLPWGTFVTMIDAGRAAILQGGYAPIADSKFDAGNGFRGNHSILVPPSWEVEDPLADGRHPGVYKYHGEMYPLSLLKSFAGHLNLEGRAGYPPRLLGSGLVYASFTRDNEPGNWHFAVNGKHGVYTVMNGIVTGSRVAIGKYSGSCTPPRLYPWPRHTSQSLVMVTSGIHKGRFIRSAYAKGI